MIWETLKLALQSIARNALRSFLTVLGVIIGVGAVIAMVTVGNGTTAQVTNDIGKLGTNLLTLSPGQGFHGPGGARTEAKPFTDDDVKAIENQISGLQAIAPTASASTTAVYGSENWNTSITGTTNGFFIARAWKLADGRIFLDSELRSGKAVCVIGETVRKNLFDKLDAIGAKIRLGKVSCEVIGVLQKKGEAGFGRDQDDTIIMPLRTVQRRFAGSTDIANISLSLANGVASEKVQRDLTFLMRERRRIAPGEDDDFHIRDMAELVSTLTGTTRMMTGLLGAVAAVSLLVGGIGIMNIMLVSVTERTREIGIRLAIGARAYQVLMQFLVEAVVLSLFGGLLGIMLGLGLALLAVNLLKVPFIFQANIVVLAFLFSVAVGVIFGYFPARRAARLDPIEALRHE